MRTRTPARLGLFTLLFAARIEAQRADTVVKLATRPVHAGVARLVEEMSIGVEAGDDNYILGLVADVAIGKNGSVFIYDRQVPIVREYDRAGKYVRSFGGKGDGPGEYRTVSGIAAHPDGRVLVWDTRAWRINVYAPTGRHMDTWTISSGGSANLVSLSTHAIEVDTAGIIYLRSRVPFQAGSEFFVRLRSDGRVIDTVKKPAFPREARKLQASNANARHADDLPFDASPLWKISPLGGLVTSLPDRYAFELHASLRPGPRSPVVSVRRDMRPEPVSRRERDSARADVIAQMVRVDPSWKWTGPDVPATKAMFTDLTVGLDGRVWVPIVPEISPKLGVNPGAERQTFGGGRPGTPPPPPPTSIAVRPEHAPRPALYDVFEPSGVYLGQVEIPARARMVAQRGDNVWAIAYDADDVGRVKRYRVAWDR